MNYNPLEDGVKHLNAYSRARTELGRMLSNFANVPIETEDGHFESIEGYWGYLKTSDYNEKREKFRTLYGIEAKRLFDEIQRDGDIGRFEPRFSEKIAKAMDYKFHTDVMQKCMKDNLKMLTLPISHYYYNENSINPKVVDVTEDYPDFINNVRRLVKEFYEEEIKGMNELFGITEGIICQQVNCKNAMGAGLADAIMRSYPVVSEKYHKAFETKTGEELFGKIQVIELSDNLYVANIFSQFDYGNPKKTGLVYTDAEKLVTAVGKICDKFPNLNVYLPHEEGTENGIGCGYGGETWSRLEPMFLALNKPNLAVLDSLHRTCHPLVKSAPVPVKKAENSVPQADIKVDPTLYEGKAVIFDTETTGLRGDDELLSISIVNTDGDVLLDTYLKPQFKKYWPAAEKVNHITPIMVKDAPYAKEIHDCIADIFDKASDVVGHNVSFDLRFVKNCIGVEVDSDKVFDTCKAFKEEVPKGKHKLGDAVDYYCQDKKDYYDSGAHGALVDAMTTMFVYNAMMEREKEETR